MCRVHGVHCAECPGVVYLWCSVVCRVHIAKSALVRTTQCARCAVCAVVVAQYAMFKVRSTVHKWILCGVQGTWCAVIRVRGAQCAMFPFPPPPSQPSLYLGTRVVHLPLWPQNNVICTGRLCFFFFALTDSLVNVKGSCIFGVVICWVRWCKCSQQTMQTFSRSGPAAKCFWGEGAIPSHGLHPPPPQKVSMAGTSSSAYRPIEAPKRGVMRWGGSQKNLGKS